MTGYWKAETNTLRIEIFVMKKMNEIWDTMPCSFIDVDRRFRGALCLNHQGCDYEDSKYTSLKRRFTLTSAISQKAIFKLSAV
jgi:hypothetical protein